MKKKFPKKRANFFTILIFTAYYNSGGHNAWNQKIARMGRTHVCKQFSFLQNHGGKSLRKQRFPKSAASFACDEMDKNPVASFYGFPRSGKWEPCDQVKT
ncbi:MAG: hypothetical protein IIT58_13265 [Treponema sp.]|nr:hypothetical protein [Treponema sp.]